MVEYAPAGGMQWSEPENSVEEECGGATVTISPKSRNGNAKSRRGELERWESWQPLGWVRAT